MGRGFPIPSPDTASVLPDPAKRMPGGVAIAMPGTDLAAMHEQMDELRALALKHAKPDWQPAFPRLAVYVDDACTGPHQSMYEPMVCFVLQGCKRVTIGDTSIEYDRATYLLATVDVPASGQIINASPDKPYISIAMRLEPSTIAALLPSKLTKRLT